MKKTIEERTIQCVEIASKLKNVGVNPDFEGMKKIRQHLNNFIHTGKNFSGKVYIKEGQFYVHLILTNNSKDCSARISKY